MKRLRMVFLVFAILMVLPACKNRIKRDEISSIVCTKTPAWGAGDEMITNQLTIRMDGSVLMEEINILGEIISTQKITVGDDLIDEIVSNFRKNKFFDLPDDVSSDSCDGSYWYIEVLTDHKNYRKGGLNPINKAFLNCYEAVETGVVQSR